MLVRLCLVVVGTQTSERLDVPISWDDLITILCNKGDLSQKINRIETLQSPFEDTFVFEQILVIGILSILLIDTIMATADIKDFFKFSSQYWIFNCANFTFYILITFAVI